MLYLFSLPWDDDACNFGAGRDPRLDRLPVYTTSLLVAASVLAFVGSLEAALLEPIVHGNSASPLLGGVRITSAGTDIVLVSILATAIVGRALGPVVLARRIGAEMEVVGRSSVNNGHQRHDNKNKRQASHCI